MSWIENKYEIAFHTNVSQLFGIIVAIRNIILNWALKLEKDFILGEGMSFSKEERKVASSTKYNIHNFSSRVSKSQMQQDGSGSSQSIIKSEFDLTELQNVINLLKKIVDQ